MGGNYLDITGERYGKLVALYRTDIKRAGSGTYWVFQCDCGTKKVIRANVVRSGKTLSCGCLVKENHPETHREQRDLTGHKYGKLIVLSKYGKDKDGLHYMSWCRCDCGEELAVRDTLLLHGRKTMCNSCAKLSNATHGKSKDRVFHVWQGMKARCYNPNNKAYPEYGGRGIRICNEWLDSTKFIEWALSNGFDESKSGDECSIERIDVNGNYEPSNCTWVTKKRQARNKQNTRYATYNGVKMPIRDIADIVGISATNIIQRMDKYGWSEYDAIHTPVGTRYGKKQKK